MALISRDAYEDIVRLLVADCRATLGDGLEVYIRERTGFHRDYLDAAAFAQRAAEAVQQAFHDEFIGTTWPTCPRHDDHPLWLENGWWSCDRDGVAIAELGGLGEVRRDPG